MDDSDFGHKWLGNRIMNVGAKVEIHFHQPEQASVYLESAGVRGQEAVAEISLFVVLAIRVFSNLGENEYSKMLAEFLVAMAGFLPSVEGMDQSPMEIIAYPGHHGRKFFVVTSNLTDEAFQGQVTTSGFGFQMEGYAYYGPMSVMTFLQFLIRKHAKDSLSTQGMVYLISLGIACRLCSQLFADRRISISNHNQLAANVILESCQTYF